jgi:hypothetical protein
MILSSHGIIGSSILQVDPDALAFFARVTAAGGTLSTTEQSAILTLVADLKDDGIWNKIKAIYPMVGASAAACAQNLKSSSFTGTFTSGWTFASTGATPNGTSAYMNTNIAPNQMGQNSIHISVYNRTESNVGIEMGSRITASNCQIVSRLGNLNYSFINQAGGTAFAQTASTGFVIGLRTNSSERIYYRNNVKTTTLNTSDAPNSITFYLCARNVNNTQVDNYDSREKAFASIGDGLTDTEASNFYTAVQAFQTTLSRNV